MMQNAPTKKIKFLIIVLGFLFPFPASAEIINPVTYIQKHGYQTTFLGDDGRTRFYSFTIRTSVSKVSNFAVDVSALPKDPSIYQVCDMMRGSVKANLIESAGIAYDVAVVNYGYKGNTISCVLKYMSGPSIGTQVFFGSKGQDGAMYNVIVTH
jgi:hypothetical protein